MVYTGKNISENSSEFFKHFSWLQGHFLEFPTLQGITLHHMSPQCFSIACTCGAIWCDVIPYTSCLLRISKALARPAYFFFVSRHTECYKVYLMSSFTLAFHRLSDFISMTVWHTGTPVPVCHIMHHSQLVVPMNWGRRSSLVVQCYFAVYFNWTSACSALQFLLLDNFLIWLLSSLDYLSPCLFGKYNLLFWVSCPPSCTIL